VDPPSPSHGAMSPHAVEPDLAALLPPPGTAMWLPIPSFPDPTAEAPPSPQEPTPAIEPTEPPKIAAVSPGPPHESVVPPDPVSAEVLGPAPPAVESSATTIPPLLVADVSETPLPPPAPVASPPPLSPPGSPVGLGFGKLSIRLDGPRARVTTLRTETISGTITGGPTTRLVLHANGMVTELPRDAGGFEVPVVLQLGTNHLKVVATDWRGHEIEDAIAVEYVPPPASERIAITSPADGHTLASEDPPFVVVEGKVEDGKVSTIWLAANDRRVPVHVQGGRFREAIPVVEPVVRLWAEVALNGGSSQRSRTVTILAAPGAPATGVLIIDWPAGVNGAHAEVSAVWRANPGRLDVPGQPVAVPALGEVSPGTPPGAFYLRNMKPGVYTFVLRYRTSAGAEVQPALWLPGKDGPSGRKLKPISLNGTGRIVLARILLPYGILWEQDDWFTGQSQSFDTVTKFRLPDGVTWTERKGDLR